MNYFLQINAFYEQLELKPLRPAAIALWHALMNVANKSGWPQVFTVSIKALSVKSGMSQKAVERARNTLAQTGHISWKSRKGSACAVYSVTNLYDKRAVKYAAQSVPQDVPQSGGQNGAQDGAINKQNPDIKEEPNITAERSNVFQSEEDGEELQSILRYVRCEELQPTFWRQEVDEYLRAMYAAPAIWVNRQRIPQREVRSRMLQLDYDAVQWQLERMPLAGEIENPRAYIMACLYNAPVDYSVFLNIQVARDTGLS